MIDIKYIPKSKILLWEHARINSNLGSQGFDKIYYCSQKCTNNKCRKNSEKLCNLKCRGGNNCSDK